ncbi:uncharacterized protein LOC112492528 isoform X2 [Ziziphus jujuba]|uniref:Uncharacterized protein LOC112492528 isoform X2 n=1 Tax=Ziziphus jujuba TaxID=326968 RepID=A0A6P6GDA3_ZIZJJ|nr:uncharacterized protein LOC112492528 isoform X2 [Ziziphus jujuba]
MLKLRWTSTTGLGGHYRIKQGAIPASHLLNNGFLSLKKDHGALVIRSNTNMNKIVCNSVQPASSGATHGAPSNNSWKGWILGMVISLILPFWRSKWGPLLKIKKEVDMVVESVENVAEIVEMVAEKVEEVADNIADKLPGDGKLKEALRLVENVAKETAKDAHLVDQLMEKVEEVEEKVESFMEPVLHEDKATKDKPNA